jgi:hypothetical protein
MPLRLKDWEITEAQRKIPGNKTRGITERLSPAARELFFTQVLPERVRLRKEDRGMTNMATNPSKTHEGPEEKPNQPSRFIIAMIPVKKKPLPPSPPK